MKTFLKIIKNLVLNQYTQQATPLGRWKLDYCNKIINRKIDLANQDNCSKLYLSKNKK